MRALCFRLCVVGFLIVRLSESALCEDAVWKLQVDLVDGSRIVGTPTNESLTVDVGFDELEIPLHRIRRAEWVRDRKTVRIELANRDVLTGVVVPTPIKMKTLFGEVILDMKYVTSVEVVPTNLLGWLPTQRGLILYYSFDREDGNRIVNLACDEHHGTASAVRWIAEGRRGGAIEFDRSGAIEVPHDGALCPATITMAMWVYPTNADSGYKMVAAKTNPGSWYDGYGIVGSSGEAAVLRFFVNSYSSSAAKVKLPPGQWSHLAGVFDGRNVSVYLNGDVADEIAVSHSAHPGAPAVNPFGGSTPSKPIANHESALMPAPIKHSTSPLWIGRNSSGYGWSGKLDEFVLYGRALSEEEITQLYEAGRVDG